MLPGPHRESANSVRRRTHGASVDGCLPDRAWRLLSPQYALPLPRKMYVLSLSPCKLCWWANTCVDRIAVCHSVRSGEPKFNYPRHKSDSRLCTCVYMIPQLQVQHSQSNKFTTNTLPCLKSWTRMYFERLFYMTPKLRVLLLALGSQHVRVWSFVYL